MSDRPPLPPIPVSVPSIPGVEDLQVIGRGGFGVVFRGHQAALGRDVAVKVLSAPGADERALELWRREVTAMGRLSNHPNIISAFSTGVTAEGLPFLVMPYVPGGSLHDAIGSHGPLPATDVARIGARLAGALGAAHAAGVLHRDVKPANVLMSEYGEPQLTDFGIARLADASATTTGSVRATIGYAAPEVLGGETATPAADVYGLGATLHAALAGQAPFAGTEGESFAARIGRVITQPPPDLRALGVAPALAEVIEATLAKDPADRPQDAEEVRRRLDALGPAQLAAGPPPVPVADRTAVMAAAPAREVPPPDGGRPGAEAASRRRILAVAGAVVAVVLLAGVVAWALVRNDGGPDEVAAGSTTTAATTPSTPETTGPTPTSTPTTTPPTPTTAFVEPTTTEARTTTTTTPPEAPDEKALRDAVTDYYGLVDDGDLDASYALLSPRFQAEQPLDSYRRFWDGIASIEVRGRPEVDVDAMTATAQLRYVRNDGTRSDEGILLTFVVADDGTLLIDQDAPAPG